MGASNWSNEHYAARATLRAQTNKPVFEYHGKVSSGAVAKAAHDTMDPSKLKGGRREARDSDAHPTTRPVFVGLDVTGSMLSVPQAIQKKLPTLMSLLINKGYLPHPAICVSGIGDAKFDRVPLQIGQFEAGIEIEDDITNLYLEGGGGGNRHESYDLALYFLARCTACDAFEKRGEKGYAFIIGDEGLQSTVLASEIRKTFGEEFHKVEEDIAVETIVEEVLERWELYHIIPAHTSHFNDAKISERWRDLLGERVVKLEEPENASELIAGIVGILQGEADLDSLAADLHEAGVDENTIKSTTRSLAKVPQGEGQLTTATGGDTGLATL